MQVFINVLVFLGAIVPLLLSVAFFTLYERQLLAALQRRQGPNIVGFYGLFQPLADGLKLFIKESIVPKSANLLLFLLAPVVTFGLARAGWTVIPLGEGRRLVDFRLGRLYLFAISSLSVHSVIRAGWSSNSKYAFLGGLRSAAQMVSYEVSRGATLVSLLILSGSLNLSTIAESQAQLWFGAPLLPIFILFFITTLAETNRHPFDLPEAEAELVSGYNVEYSARGFALFFLAEYANIILRSSLSGLLFFGGGHSAFPLVGFLVPPSVTFALKTRLFITLFVLVRGTLPRYRYDQLRRLGWKVFLPLSLAFLIRYASVVLSRNGVVELVRLLYVLMSFLFTSRDLTLLIAFLGALGLLVNKRHLLLSVICIERRFYGLNLFLVVLSLYLDDRLGQIFALFVLTLAAAESALALALLRAYFQVYSNILLRNE